MNIDNNDAITPSGKRYRLEHSCSMDDNDNKPLITSAARKTLVTRLINDNNNNNNAIMQENNELHDDNNNNNNDISYNDSICNSVSDNNPSYNPAELKELAVETLKTPILSREMSVHASRVTSNSTLPATGLNSPLIGPRSSVYTPPISDKHEPIAFNRVNIQYHASATIPEYKIIANNIRIALELRQKFLFRTERDPTQYNMNAHPLFKHPDANDIPKSTANIHHVNYKDGIYSAWQGNCDNINDAKQVYVAPNRKDYSHALQLIMDLASDGPCKSFCHNRLHLLEARFNLHELLNHDLETAAQKAVPHRDFYNVRKIDTHVHHSACMNQKHLLRFIKYKLKNNPNQVVIIRDNKALTLAQVFESLNLTPYDLNVDTLDMHADKTFHRFDKFNLKYNPIGESRLREIFLKYSNFIKGEYLAELTKQVFDDLESNKYQFAEYRISIYGSNKNEWNNLAEWIVDNKLFHFNVRWMIQTPRLYGVYKQANKINNFGDMIKNIFEPLFDVTINPQSNPKLHLFLQQCVGYDIVDDESVREKSYHDNMPTPDEWNFDYDPPYALFAYYVYANLYSLNLLRQSKGFTTFSFRPHAGEAGDHEHLACTFLLAKSINHGLMLQKSPALQYLYYLAQIGISMSPLSNNLLFLEYDKNPFPRFFQRGLNVTLSTDDPLMIHVTKEPLVEEYSVAAQVWKLTSIDMSEIARNSVLQSDFEHRFKAHFLGNNYWIRGVQGNDLRQTNVPAMRVQFRAELLGEELKVLSNYGDKLLTSELVDTLWQ